MKPHSCRDKAPPGSTMEVETSAIETLSMRLATFVEDLTYKKLPQQVVNKAKIETLDLLGAILGGSQTESGRMISQLAIDQGGKPQATILGQSQQVPAPSAALANGTMAFILDVDSGEYGSMAHIGAAVLPALLAASEYTSISGKDFITALVGGYDVAIRIGRAVQPSHRARGFWGMGTFPTFGASAAAAKAMRLTHRKVTHAIGLAGLQASGLGVVEGVGSMGRQFLVGKAAQNGIMAVLMADRGFTAPVNLLEGDRGFLKTMAAYDAREIIWEDLGKVFLILDGYNKPYPSCRFIHSALDAIFELVEEHDLLPDQVASIHVDSNQITWDLCRSYDAKDYWGEPSPIFSLPLSMAIALTIRSYGHADQSRFPDLVGHPKIRALAERVTLKIDERLEQISSLRPVCDLAVTTTDNRKLKVQKAITLGDPEEPLSLEVVADNFRFYASPAIGENKAEKIVDLVSNLERVEQISQITRHLVKLGESKSD